MARSINPGLWASLKPFGIGEQHPNNFAEVSRAILENRDEAAFAWRIISEGVCDGCALGVAGLHDWTLDGPHLCNIRLRLLRLNTMPAFDPAILADVDNLRSRSSKELRELGRVPYPMMRRRGEPGFKRCTWDDALDLTAERIRATDPNRTGYYLTSRGVPNETYYVAQKAVRAMGSNNVDNAARICHSPSTVSLKASLGVSATTCSYTDWIGSDLIVFIGANPANNQPVTTKYMHHARAEGTRIVSVNTMREPGMERYWIPSIPESALFGTKLLDDTFLVNTGGDVAFLTGALKHMIERGQIDRTFVDGYTDGFDALASNVSDTCWGELERGSGTTTSRMRAFGELIGTAKTAVFVWSMGVTQHTYGEATVRAIVNLALTRGFVGRDKCGLMPIRGHSGVQGGAEMGAYATAFPGTIPISPKSAESLSATWGFDVPSDSGLTAPAMIDAAAAGDLDVMLAMGGNFLEALPDPVFVASALERIPTRVHLDIVLSSQMLLEPADTVVLLPATTRYEVPGGVTQTSTERRIMFSPEIKGRRIGEARPEWRVFSEIAQRVRPDRKEVVSFAGTPEIRAEIASVVPAYDGIQHLARTGDQFQYGGSHLCAGWSFPTSSGRAAFGIVPLPEVTIPDGQFAVATRRGKQFNTMVHETQDAMTGASARDAVFVNRRDLHELGLQNGDAVILRNSFGEMRGHVYAAPTQSRNVQVFWPEGNVLLDRSARSNLSNVPDYNAFVTIEPSPRSASAD